MALAMLALGMAACNGHIAPEFNEVTTPDEAEMRVATFRAQSGEMVRWKTGMAPMNMELRCYDAEGDLIGMAGTASEWGYFRFVKVLFDSDKRVKGFALGSTAEEYEDFHSTDGGNSDSAWKREFDYMMGRIYGNNYDGKEWERYFLRRDRQGNIVKVFDPQNEEKVLECPKGFRIVPELRESDAFWEDDLEGGRVLLLFNVQPMNPHRFHHSSEKYCGYKLQRRMEFEDGELLQVDLFDQKGQLYGTYRSDVVGELERFEMELGDLWRGLY